MTAQWPGHKEETQEGRVILFPESLEATASCRQVGACGVTLQNHLNFLLTHQGFSQGNMKKEKKKSALYNL